MRSLRGSIMFDASDICNLDKEYFSVIFVDAFDVTIMSRNTGHFWFIHNPEYPTPGTCIIFHKHKASHPYHQHGRANSLKQAVRSIQSHDRWQMQGRPSKRCLCDIVKMAKTKDERARREKTFPGFCNGDETNADKT